MTRTVRGRTRPSLFARIRTFWVIALLVLLVASIAFAAFANLPQLRLRTIEATVPVGGPVTKEAVLAAAAIAPGANVVLLGTGAVRTRVEAIPYVQAANVHRTFLPQPAIDVEVTVRTPYACLASRRGTATIDAAARVLQNGCVNARLPQVGIGDGALPAPGARLDDPANARLLADLATVSARLQLRSIGRDRFDGLEAIDARGVTIRFGADDDLAAKLALIEPIRRSATPGRPLRAIDLRAPTTPVVEYP